MWCCVLNKHPFSLSCVKRWQSSLFQICCCCSNHLTNTAGAAVHRPGYQKDKKMVLLSHHLCWPQKHSSHAACPGIPPPPTPASPIQDSFHTTALLPTVHRRRHQIVGGDTALLLSPFCGVQQCRFWFSRCNLPPTMPPFWCQCYISHGIRQSERPFQIADHHCVRASISHSMWTFNSMSLTASMTSCLAM